MIIPLIKGLMLTLSRFFSKPITIQYPEEKRTPYPTWRGIHYFMTNEKGETICVACGLCVAYCPSQCITLEIGEREDGSRYPIKYEIDSLRCIFCGFCQEICPVNAIRMSTNYEYVQYEKENFKLTKERLISLKEKV